MRTFTTETAAAAFELEQLVIDYWREVDMNDAANITDFYTEDSTYKGGIQLFFKGREGVRKFYDNVRATRDADRIVRHTITNMQVTVHDQKRGTVNYIIVTYGKSGKKPISGLTGPSQVTDVHLECRREADGKWRIAAFVGDAVFVGGDSLLNQLPKT
jgi:ketosteroid isomerase-like protein